MFFLFFLLGSDPSHAYDDWVSTNDEAMTIDKVDIDRGFELCRG
jgi:hypothetical protein